MKIIQAVEIELARMRSLKRFPYPYQVANKIADLIMYLLSINKRISLWNDCLDHGPRDKESLKRLGPASYPLCGCPDILYSPEFCKHFTLKPCRSAKYAYCIPYKTLLLRKHKIGNCPDGVYSHKE